MMNNSNSYNSDADRKQLNQLQYLQPTQFDYSKQNRLQRLLNFSENTDHLLIQTLYQNEVTLKLENQQNNSNNNYTNNNNNYTNNNNNNTNNTTTTVTEVKIRTLGDKPMYKRSLARTRYKLLKSMIDKE
ncbi:hypothetical protein WICMUC_005263 [Wickerhamomyces mucosus]|uniref:Uncharacterized protein n=1 Tax=Wickerhamomyces mucosus TaxID=1378264 RepID=A0A9P8T698_9ASCO|nr:hypothetical protein WICMUC_005263 [Wickerhamomyces mucosus]